MTPEEMEKKKKEEAESRQDIMYIGIAVFLTLALITSIMVRLCLLCERTDVR